MWPPFTETFYQRVLLTLYCTLSCAIVWLSCQVSHSYCVCIESNAHVPRKVNSIWPNAFWHFEMQWRYMVMMSSPIQIGKLEKAGYENMGLWPFLNWQLVIDMSICLRFLVDTATLNIANRWRRERGESELLASEVNPTDQSINPA